MEVDLAFFDDPTEGKADVVDGAIGELSAFHEMNGCTHELSACGPRCYQKVGVAVSCPGRTGPPAEQAVFLEPYDCVVSKLVAWVSPARSRAASSKDHVHNWRMPELGRTWMVLLRDVSHAVHVVGEDRLMAALVLHAETGLVLGVSIRGTAPEALSSAFDAALTNQAGELPPTPPARVVSLVEVAPEVRKAVAAASFGSPQLVEAGSLAEAEDIFDSLVGHMAGRAQPTEPPSTEDWSLLFGQALAYLRAEPWVRWSDVVPLGLQLTVDGTAANYVAIVMGNAGVQRGLALYPGVTLPSGLRWPGSAPGPAPALEATPSGSLLLMLDGPGESPDEFAKKALRYGWPADAAYIPALVGVGSDGPSDLAGADAQRLQMALAAVLAIDSRGPVLAEVAGATTGRVALADGAHGDFVITQ